MLATTFLGRYQVGDHIPLFVQCTNSTGVPTDATLCPTYSVLDSTGAVVASGQVPIRDAATLDGWFGQALRIASAWAAGLGCILYSYAISGTNYADMQTFTILAGGSADSEVIALDQYRRPEAGHLMIETEDGDILSGRNPQASYP